MDRARVLFIYIALIRIFVVKPDTIYTYVTIYQENVIIGTLWNIKGYPNLAIERKLTFKDTLYKVTIVERVKLCNEYHTVVNVYNYYISL